MRRTITFAVALVLVLAFAAPALAQTGANGLGRAYGMDHSTEARMNHGFTGTTNPGVEHRGFSGWTP